MYFDYALFTRHHGAGVIQSYNRKHDHHHHGAVKTARISKDDDDRREDDVTDSLVIHYDNLLYIASLCGAFAMSLSAVSLGIMTLFARHVVQVALVMVITLSFVWGTIGIGLSPHNFVPITGIIALALSVAYAFIVWDRIPFATANVLTALTAVRTYPTLTVLALMFQSLALAWSIYFCVVTIGVYDAIQENKLVLTRNWAIALYTALGVSYYWTFQVLSNILKACTASVIGSWWHNEIEPGVVSKAVFKTVFYSMGSICYGSLFVEPVNFLRQLAIIFRPSTTEDATLLCFHECLRLLANCITSMVDMLTLRFNHWAFTYIGMYNYSFSEAAHRAHELFEKRGWSLIVSDDLVPNLLLMTSLVLGGLTGCFAGLLEWVDVLQISSLNEPGLVSFVLGTVIGIVLSNILFGVIHSSVNTVIVCFAAEPLDFQQNHPQLSDEMREAWREVWPGALDAVDMRMAMAQARSSPVPSRKMPPGESLTPPLLVSNGQFQPQSDSVNSALQEGALPSSALLSPGQQKKENERLEATRREQARLDFIVQSAGRSMVPTSKGNLPYYNDQGFAAALAEHLEKTTSFPEHLYQTLPDFPKEESVFTRLSQGHEQQLQGMDERRVLDQTAESYLDAAIVTKERLFAGVKPIVESLI
ncbi:hypothetical protein MPSEU_000409300 [Mayamaea pseudoterrestris]|nr:hypothetical protein MPSEU_000409300 [Mayamaea pseudoterrestris]